MHGRIKVFWSLTPCLSQVWGVFPHLSLYGEAVWCIAFSCNLRLCCKMRPARDMCSMGRSFQLEGNYQPSRSSLRFLLAWARWSCRWPTALCLTPVPEPGKAWSGWRMCGLVVGMMKLLAGVIQHGPALAATSARVWVVVPPTRSCLVMPCHQQKRKMVCGLCYCLCSSSCNLERAALWLPLKRGNRRESWGSGEDS